MAKVEKQVLHHCFAQAKEQYKLGKIKDCSLLYEKVMFSALIII